MRVEAHARDEEHDAGRVQRPGQEPEGKRQAAGRARAHPGRPRGRRCSRVGPEGSRLIADAILHDAEPLRGASGNRHGPLRLRCSPPMTLDRLAARPAAWSRDGAPVSFDTRKATALLAYLALAERAHARDALAELLWPDHDTAHARGALRRTLSTLRQAIGDEHLETTRDRVALADAASLDLDVRRFRR